MKPRVVVLYAKRPSDPRYPEGNKRIEVTVSKDVELVGRKKIERRVEK